MKNKEDFKIVRKYYATSSLIMIFYLNIIIASVEIYKNYKVVEDKSVKKEDKKPIVLKSSKEKRTEVEINVECEKIINNFIKS
tara:strand:+ start:15643 stop:15891 length:249 start_codon:yes stop_codon:yes gene_type:complete